MESSADLLFSMPRAFDYCEKNNQLFIEACREMFLFHTKHSRIYKGVVEQSGFSIADIQTEEDLYRIPSLIVTAFKERKLLSVPENEIVQTFLSSGTTGQQSQINWDEVSMARQRWMRDVIVDSYGLYNADQEVNNLIFSYDPASSGLKGAANTHIGYTKYAKGRETFFAIQADTNGEPRFLLDECIETLERYSTSGLPLRITGFPAFGYFTLRKLKEMGRSFRFPQSSLLFSGGGWKTHTGENITYDQYAQLVQDVLGITRDRIRDIYGMVEHGVPYITCEHGHFHVPVYSRVCAVDPRTMQILPEGEVGLLKLITPYIRSTPSLSVLSTDLGIVNSSCPCGRQGRYIELKGRGGVKKYAGCGISAAQLLSHV